MRDRPRWWLNSPPGSSASISTPPISATVPATAGRPTGAPRDRHPHRDRSGCRRARRRQPRDDRLALEAPRLRLPVLRDLRRHQRRLGLRPARGRAEEQRQAGLVAVDGPGARGHRRPRCRDPHAPPGLGHVRPRRLVQRPARRVRDTVGRRYRLDELPGAEGLTATDLMDPDGHRALQARLPESTGSAARPAAPVQPDVPDAHGPGPGRRVGRLSSGRRRPRARTSTSRTSSRARARRSRSGSPRSASRSGTRSAPATSSSGCASSSRWRCSTSSGRTPRRRPSRSGSRSRRAWYERYGVTPERLRFREHAPDELAHYAKKAIDVEYRFPFGWKELEGDPQPRRLRPVASHAEASGENLEYFDPATEEHFIPWVVETAGGADRAAFTFLIDAYREEEVRGEKRVVLGFHPEIRAVQGRGPAAAQEAARDRRDLPPAPGRPREGRDGGLRRHRGDRQALPAPGRDRDAVVRDRRRRVARGRRGDGPRSRLDDPGAGAARGRQAADPRPTGGLAGG